MLSAISGLGAVKFDIIFSLPPIQHAHGGSLSS